MDSQLSNPGFPSSNSRQFNIYHTFFNHHYSIHTADKRLLLYVDNSLWTPGKPDLTFHAGPDNKAPVVAACKFIHFSRGIRVGFGDLKDPNSVTWEELSCQNVVRASKYRIDFTIRDDSGSSRRSFLWTRAMFTHDHDLVDEQTGETIAQFDNSAFSLSKTGKLYIHKHYGQDFELMVLTTAIGLIEKHRRRQSGGGGGGGGDGGG